MRALLLALLLAAGPAGAQPAPPPPGPTITPPQRLSGAPLQGPSGALSGAPSDTQPPAGGCGCGDTTARGGPR